VFIPFIDLLSFLSSNHSGALSETSEFARGRGSSGRVETINEQGQPAVERVNNCISALFALSLSIHEDGISISQHAIN
jgi:hypothetical protein